MLADNIMYETKRNSKRTSAAQAASDSSVSGLLHSLPAPAPKVPTAFAGGDPVQE